MAVRYLAKNCPRCDWPDGAAVPHAADALGVTQPTVHNDQHADKNLSDNRKELNFDNHLSLKHDKNLSKPIPAPELYGVSLVYADPPWQYDFSPTDSRKIENQYPTATVDEIINHFTEIELADDSILFLWATAPKLLEALRVMEAWGFRYRTNAVWDKEIIGMGYWFRSRHELLLLGTSS